MIFFNSDLWGIKMSFQIFRFWEQEVHDYVRFFCFL